MTNANEDLRAALLMITHKANEANIHRDEDGVLETIIEIARAALAAAPQPAPEREALVGWLDREFSAWNETSFDTPLTDYLADALLARGLRLPGPETMAWGVVDKHGNLDPHTIYPDEWMADRKVDPGERLVRVAIRVVEGGDDE